MADFGELEAVVMDHVWDATGPLTVRDMLDRLIGVRDVAYTTVSTVMDNLLRKGWLTREKSGLAYLYQPVCTREEYRAQLMRQALSGSEDRTAVLMHFVRTMSAGETQTLRDVLKRAPRTKDAKP
jgi:predicted transcriptional regulator